MRASGLHRLLSRLTPEAEAALSGATAFECARGARLIEAGAPLATLYFVTQGLVAVVVRDADGAAETGLVGRGGVIGHTALLGERRSAVDCVALTATSGLAVEPGAVAAALVRAPALNRALLRYTLSRISETERLCACAARHPIEKRLAGWLLRAAGLLGDAPIEATHHQLAELLGVRRASVTTSLHMLEGESAVRCGRGRVEIRDARRLEALACACHRQSPAVVRP